MVHSRGQRLRQYSKPTVTRSKTCSLWTTEGLNSDSIRFNDLQIPARGPFRTDYSITHTTRLRMHEPSLDLLS